MNGALRLRRSRMPSVAGQDMLNNTHITPASEGALAQAVHACLVEVPGTLHRIGEGSRNRLADRPDIDHERAGGIGRFEGPVLRSEMAEWPC